MRTVGTRLTVDAKQAKAELRDTERAARSFEDELIDAAKQGKLTADAIADIGKTAVGAFPPAEKAAAKLNDEIAETAREIQRLDREFRRTGDVALFADLERQLVRLKAKLKARDFFDRRDGERMGEQLVEGISAQIVGRLGPVMARMPLNVGALGPVGGSVAGALAVGMVPVLGSAVAGAVVGGAGVGGIIGGVVLAAGHPAVREEAKVLGAEFGNMLESSAQDAFVPVLRRQAAALRKEVSGFEPFVRAIFAKSAQLVDPLRKGAVGFAKEAIQGIVALVDQARPVIDVIARRLPEAGKAVKEALEDISGDSRSAAAAVDLILQGLIGIVRFGGNVIAFLTDMFRKMVESADAATTLAEALGGWNPLISGRIQDTRDRIDGLKSVLNGTSTAANDTVNPLNDLGEAAGTTAEEVKELKEAFDGLFGQLMNLDEATIAYEQGIADLNEELTDGKRTLDTNTKAGRENASATLDQIQRIKNLRDSRIAHGMTLDEANRKYVKDIEGLRKTMLQAGYTKAEVDRLIGKYKQIPAKIDTKVAVAVRDANNQITGFLRRINTIDGRVITVRTRITSAGEYIPGQGTSVRRWGGVTEHAQTGLLREASMFSPGTRYAFAEPATGGEAFIPRRGNFERSAGIWAKVGRDWLGMRPGGGGGGAVTVRIVVDGAETDLKRVIAKWVRTDAAFAAALG